MSTIEPMSVYVAALYELQQWECLNKQYAPKFFKNTYQGFVNGLRNGSGKTFLKILNDPRCIEPGCGIPIDLTRSVLDHIIPKKKGGPDILENRIPLCKKHNSSKGTKDLIEWWLFKGHKPIELPRNILAIYARVYWQFGDAEIMTADAPEYIHDFFMERCRTCNPPLEPFHMIAIITTAEQIARDEYIQKTGGNR